MTSFRRFVQVVTTKATFTCRKLVVTAGAWLNDVLGSIGVHVPVTVTQEQVTYFATPHIKDFTKDKSVTAPSSSHLFSVRVCVCVRARACVVYMCVCVWGDE